MDVTRLSEPSSIFSAKDLVIVITGGGSGIGHAMAAAVCKTGVAKVYILGRRHNVLTKAAKSIDPTGTTVVPIQCDVDSIASVTAAVQAIESDTGYIDVLINNAGRPGHPSPSPAQTIDDLKNRFLTGMDDGSALACFQTNAMSVIAVSGMFLPLLDKGNQRRGWQGGKIPMDAARQRISVSGIDEDDSRTSQIISVSSLCAYEKSAIAGLPYGAGKAAVSYIASAMATMLAPWGIRSNTFAPGFYLTEMTPGNAPTNGIPVSSIPAGQPGGLDTVAGVVLYLVGKGGSFTNGGVVQQDGGQGVVSF